MAVHTLVVKLTGRDEVIRSFLSDFPAEPTKVTKGDGLVSVQIDLPADRLRELEARHIEHAVLYDATERDAARPREVGRQRFAPGRPPLGLGSKPR